MRKPRFQIGHYEFISQDPTALPESYRPLAERLLPVFLQIWQAVEQVTGHRWKLTSYIRRSPSHHKGQAIDLAPDFTIQAEKHYGVHKGSDPVLYKRKTLIKQLSKLASTDFTGNYPSEITGIFIEPDHLHIQVLANDDALQTPTRVVKWKIVKPAYADSAVRAALPDVFEPYLDATKIS